MLAEQVGDDDIIPAVVGLSPEMGIPLMVQLIQRLIFPLQPDTEGFFTIFTVTGPAVFIAHVPGCNIFLILIVLCQFFRKTQGKPPEAGAVGTGVMPAAKLSAHTVKFRTQHIRILSCHPCGMGRGGICHADLHPVFRHPCHRVIQCGKIIGLFIRLQHRPVEHI